MTINPYALSFINLFLCFFLFLGVLFYKFVYPKKKINLFFLLILISLLPIWSIFRLGDYQSGDFNIHIYRTIDFFRDLSEGVFMPSWAANLNATYGYPLFSFNYTLPYYFLSFIHFFGFSYILTMKLFLASNLFFSGIFMFFACRNYFKDELAGFTSAIFYIFAPYHLISIHFKITIGEILAFTILPLIFLFLNKFIQKPNVKDFLTCSLFLGLLALSHIYIAIIFITFLFIYFLYKFRDKSKSIIYSFSISLLAALISIYQWSSSIIYYSYLFIKAYPPDTSALYYPNFLDLLYSPWRFGLLFQGPKGELSFLIGYAQIFVIIFLLYKSLKGHIQPKIRKEIIFWLLVLMTTIIGITPLMKFFWESIPLVGNAGTQRLLLLVGFISSILAGFIVTTNTRKILVYFFVCFSILSTLLNWGQRTLLPSINDKSLIENLPYSTAQGEAHFYANTKWVNPNSPWFSKIPGNNLTINSGDATLKNISRTTIKHVYLVNAKTKLSLTENTLYFPGWIATSNGKQVLITPNKAGIVTFNLPKGNQTVVLSYSDLNLFSITKIISIVILFSILIYLLLNFNTPQA